MTDQLISLGAVAIASGVIGAVLEYLGHAWHHDHKKGHR